MVRKGKFVKRGRVGRRTGAMRRIARERMDILFDQARMRSDRGQPALARRCCQLARRISMRYKVPLRPHQRRLYCRGCGEYLTPGRSSTVRLRRGKVNVRCAGCGRLMRFPLSGGRGEEGGGSDAGRDIDRMAEAEAGPNESGNEGA